MAVDIEKQQQTLMVLWAALLMSIGSYFLFALFAGPAISESDGKAPNSVRILALTALGILLVMVSVLVKRKFRQWSVEKQDTGFVRKGLVIACAICEVSALLGLLDRFVIGERQYYLLFLIAAAGMALHRPRREHLLAAIPRIPIAGATS